MSRTLATSVAGLAVLLLASGFVGCNAFGITGEDDENEVRVTVQALGADFLNADDGFTYEVDADTEFEGYSSFADIAVGDIVEIEFEEIANSNNRRALEIEADGASED